MQTLELKSTGLFSHQNPLSAPPGSFKFTTNTVMRREDITETTRGSKVVFSFSDYIHKIMDFRGRAITQSGLVLSYDSTGAYNFINYANPFEGPNYPIFSASANQNFFFTTSKGIYKIDAITNQPRQAGVPQGLGGIPTLIAPTANILPDGQTIAYRVIWGYKDANDNTILGAPSPRAVISNSSGGPQDISLQFFIPDDIDTIQYFYQVYRAVPTTIGTAPLDEMYLIDEVTLTSTDLFNGFVTYVDHKTTTGAAIYTAPSQQGIQNSNFVPPLAKDITLYNGMMFYLNIQTRQSATVILSSALDDGFGYFDKTGDTTTGSFDILNLTDVDDIRVGQVVTSVDFPVGTKVVNIVPPTTVNLDQASTGTTVGIAIRFSDVFTVGGEEFIAFDADSYVDRQFLVTNDIEETALSLTNIINSLSSNYSAYYQGIGVTDVGKIIIQTNNIQDAAFNVDSTFRGAFVNNLPLTSTADILGHGFQVSKVDQPEAVPLSTLYRVGTGEYPIVRGIALRDAVYIFKGDGIFRVTGTSPQDLVIRKIDSSTKIIGKSTAVILDNNIICFSDQGVIQVNQSGVQILSLPIHTDLLKISTPNTQFEDVAFGVVYETEREYRLFCNSNSEDTTATQAWVFNTITQGWTREKHNATSGLVISGVNKLLIGNLERLREERKDYAFSDYALDETPVFIQSFSGVTVNLTSSAGVQVGWFLVQNEASSKIIAINGNTLTLRNEIEILTTGAATAFEPIITQIQWNPLHGGNPVAFKHFQDFYTLHDDSKFEEMKINFFSDLICPEEFIEVIPEVEGGFGECSFGEEGFGELHQPAQPIRTLVPLEQSRAPWISVLLTLEEAYGKLALSGQSVTFEEMGGSYR